jgi:alpha-beta hydrolase superfamily lysophospholipase
MTLGKLSACLLLALALGAAPGPRGDAFYSPPLPLPAGKPGDVIWYRDLRDGPDMPHSAANYLVLYHTVSATGADVAVSGTLSIPRGAPPSGGWPIVSWTHGTTGNAFFCTPSTETTTNGEQKMMDQYVAHGYAVAQTDYEGQGTPGIHPYFVAAASAHDATDIVRAARQIDPQIGTRWIVMGHSEGGAAALATAAYGPAWAPELQLVGVVAYAPGSHLPLFLQGIETTASPTSDLAYFALMVQGMATADPSIDLSAILSPGAKVLMPQLQRRCVNDMLRDPDWNAFSPSSFFAKGADLTALQHDFEINDPDNFTIKVPVFLLQGTADTTVSAQMTNDLSFQLCQRGANVLYDIRKDETHFTVLDESVPRTIAWVDARFAGVPIPARGCDLAPTQ